MLPKLLILDPEFHGLLRILTIVIKFFSSISYLIANVQSTEVYPTCLRQTGLGLGYILSNAVGIVAPYLVYFGTTYDIRCPYYTLGVLSLIGGTLVSFLPETLHHKMPDTLQEGKAFGKDQQFFSLPKPNRKYCEVSEKMDDIN